MTMSPSLSTAPGSAVSNSSAARLRNLYLARFAFALAWAALLAASASSLNPLSVALLIAYPVFDLGAAVRDARSAAGSGLRGALVLNMAVSLLAAVALAAAAGSGIAAVLRVWGAWAIAAGLAQLAVAVKRYPLGGQWPMVLSGGISVLAGIGFVAMASSDDPRLTALAGYATLGGLFFAASAIRLHRPGATA